MGKKIKQKRSALLWVALLSGSLFAQEFDLVFDQGALPFSSDPGVATQMQRVLKMVGKDMRAEKRAPGTLYSEGITADYALEFYSFAPSRDSSDFSGTIHTIGVANGWQLPQSSLRLEAGFREMLLSPEESGGAWNHIFTGGIHTPLLDREKLYWNLNTGFDLIFYSEAFDVEEKESEVGLNFQINTSAQIWIDEHQLSGGLALQGLFATKRLLDLGVAVGWSRRIHARFDFGAELAYHLILIGALEEYSFEENAYLWESIDYDNTPHALSLHAHGTFLLTDKIGFQLGYRTHLLIADYSSHAITANGRFIF